MVNPFRGRRILSGMFGRVILPLLLASSATYADEAWSFEPNQTLVAVAMGSARAEVSAVSLGLTGSVRQMESGGVQVNVRIATESFRTGNAARDAKLREGARSSEILYRGLAGSPAKDGALFLRGTLTFHGVSRPLNVPVSITHAGGLAFGHATFIIHLGDFGVPVPEGTDDEVRVEVDAGLRPVTTVASANSLQPGAGSPSKAQ
jgi:polyisoprenoid-binding protein YceI